MKNLLKFTGMFLIFFVASCSNGGDDSPIIDPTPNPTTITYTNTISGIVSGNCTGCHGSTPSNGAPMSLTTYNNVKDAVVSRGLINQIETGNMPKNATDLTATQIQNFKTWQANDFPQ